MMFNSDAATTAKSQKFTKRQLRAFGIVMQGGQISKVNDTHFTVKSQSSNHAYKVVFEARKWSCNCPDFGRALKPCKHIYALQYYLNLPKIAQANGYAKA